MELSAIREEINSKIKGAVVGEDLDATPSALIIEAGKLYAVCELLHTSDKFYFDQLSCLTGIDNGPEAGSMEVVYNLYSIPFNYSLMLKVTLDRNSPKISSVSNIWRTANWHEREAFDLLGIEFIDHPDLRRILLPRDWVGYPLRKDYKEQETYHGMTVVYDRDSKPEGFEMDN